MNFGGKEVDYLVAHTVNGTMRGSSACNTLIRNRRAGHLAWSRKNLSGSAL